MTTFNITIRYSDTTFGKVFHQEFASDDVHAVLEDIFAEWNSGSGRECEAFTSNRTTRSLSVGDFVKVNDQWFRCASFGWDEVSDAEVTNWFYEMEMARWNRVPGRTFAEERQLVWADKRKVEDKLGIA